MIKYERENYKKDDMEIIVMCAFCHGAVDSQDNFCRHCGYKFNVVDPEKSSFYKQIFKKGYNAAKRDMIRLLTKEV